MITFNNIVNLGRLGNQMFQYATLLSLGMKKGIPIGFSQTPLKSFDGGDTVFNFQVSRSICDSPRTSVYEEPSFQFDDSLFDIEDGSDILGYFQSWKYFDEIRGHLLREFTPNDQGIVDKVEKYVRVLKKEETPICAMHIRRGDYVQKQDYHPLCDISYYKKAMKSPVVSHMKMVIVTDDKDWARETFPGVLVSEMDTNLEDLWLIRSCDGVIMANSSFSWWGAYLGPNTNVVAPSKWFGNSINTKDLYHPNWSVIE